MGTPWVERPRLPIDWSAWNRGEVPPWTSNVTTDAHDLLIAMAEFIPAPLHALVESIDARTRGRFRREFEACAAMTGCDWRLVGLANCCYDLTMGTMACSTLALPTADGPVLARNMDWFPEGPIARATYQIEGRTAAGRSMQVAGFPGASAVVTGQSSAGFALAINAVASGEPLNINGYPALLLLRTVVEDAKSFAEARERLNGAPLVTGAMITLVGRENHERVVLERTPSRCVERWGESDKALITTNDYCLLHRPTTLCARFDRLQTLLERWNSRRTVTNAELLYHLTDSQVEQTITAQHVVMRPAHGTMFTAVPRRLLPET